MNKLIKARPFTMAGLALAVALPATQACAEQVFALAAGNTVVLFDTSAPGTVTSTRSITGIAQGDTLVGLDLRPATRQLYTVGTSGNLYQLKFTGNSYAATTVGTIAPSPSGANFGIDFNPVPDRLRLISESNQNLRINPNNAVTLVDTAITLNGSPNVDIIASAYINSFAGATTTVLYGLDALSDSLLRATNANAGTYVTVGPLGASFSRLDRVSFDISGVTGTGFLSIGDNFYSINLATGTSSLIGGIDAEGVTGLTVAGVPEPASWAMLIAGFGLVGAAMRRRNAALARDMAEAA